jgi:hypothetical protein
MSRDASIAVIHPTASELVTNTAAQRHGRRQLDEKGLWIVEQHEKQEDAHACERQALHGRPVARRQQRPVASYPHSQHHGEQEQQQELTAHDCHRGFEPERASERQLESSTEQRDRRAGQQAREAGERDRQRGRGSGEIAPGVRDAADRTRGDQQHTPGELRAGAEYPGEPDRQRWEHQQRAHEAREHQDGSFPETREIVARQSESDRHQQQERQRGNQDVDRGFRVLVVAHGR